MYNFCSFEAKDIHAYKMHKNYFVIQEPSQITFHL